MIFAKTVYGKRRSRIITAEAIGADFNYTRFKIENGAGFHIGMLVREIR